MNSQEPAPTLELCQLVQGWRTLTLTTASGMLIGVLLLQIIQPRQEVTAKLLIEPQGSALDGKYSSSREKEFLPTQAEVISSPAVISNAVRKTQTLLSEVEAAGRVVAVAKELKVDPLAGTNVLFLRYSDRTAQHAVGLVNALINAYREYLATAELSYQQQMLTLLKSQEQEYQTQLVAVHAEYERLVETRKANFAPDANASGRVLSGLEESLAVLQSHRLQMERAVEQFALRSQASPKIARANVRATEDSFLETTADSPVNEDDLRRVVQDLAALSRESWSGIQNPVELETRLVEARGRVSELTTALGPQHPELLSARAAVLRYEQELRRVVLTAPTTIQLALNGIRQEEESLQQRYDSHLRLASEAELLRLKENRKMDEIDRLQRASEGIQLQLQQWQTVDYSTAGGQTGISVTILEAPMPTERSFAANPLIITGISGLLGLLAGVSGLVVMPQISRMFRTQPFGTSAMSSGIRVQESVS